VNPVIRERSRDSNRGQALAEFLILLPVLLLLFLATAEIAKLFAISGKTEVAARYVGSRWFRDYPFEPKGSDFTEPQAEAEIADRANNLFFEGSLGDSDQDDVDTGYREFQPGDGGVFEYDPPPLDSIFWDVLAAYFDPNNNLFPIRGNRVTFHYDLPYFPYKEMDDETPWGEDEDPVLGPYPKYTAKGDYVVLTATFAGNTDNFLGLLQLTGLINSIPADLVTVSIGILIFFVIIGG